MDKLDENNNDDHKTKFKQSLESLDSERSDDAEVICKECKLVKKIFSTYFCDI